VRRRLAELESENSELGKGMEALEARLERLERNSPDKPPAPVSNKEQSGAETAGEETRRQAARREWRSNEAIGLAAAVGGGVLVTVADFTSALPATYAGIGASALGVGAATVGWYRRHREAKDAHRPGH
jgi:uncharacterized protein YlxW (UPF0749 family)